MAYYSFTRELLAGRPIAVFNQGRMRRNFTYIVDIVDGVLGVLDRPPAQRADGDAPRRVLNIGSQQPVPLLEFIGELERALGVQARLDLQPMQPGDVTDTFADVQRLEVLTGRRPETPLRDGVERFVGWYLDYHAQELRRSA